MSCLMISISVMLSIMFLFLNHPLSMGLILLLQTIMMCLISGFMSPSFWFSYILLLIYLGGMLVLFMYITSLAPNEMFFYSNKTLSILLAFPLIILFMYYNKLNHPMNLYENLENITSLNLINNNFLLKMYNYPTNMITITIATYLFLTLIAVVKITYMNKGPLRQMN
nr:NADH dehydrogenase subunit 6 [Idolomantis diabolica]